MRKLPFRVIPSLAMLLALAPAARAQQGNLHIGYVYPAGGKQGTTFEAVIGGQFLTGVNRVYVSGDGVQARITGLVQPMSNRERNQLRIQIDELLARKAVVRNDFRALEAFRSFKNAKTTKTASAGEDKQIEALKKKYAGATWTAADENLLKEIRRKMAMGVRRPANPAIGEIAIVQLTVAADAEPGRRDLRIAGPAGLSNPLAFYVGQLSEFSEEAIKQITEQKSAVAKTAVAPTSRKAKPEMEITLPAVVNGQIMPGEVDRYRFTGSKGQRLVLAASARQLIPYIADAVPGWFQATLALYDAQGRELAYDDDFRFHPDPVLYYELPADGQYTVEIKDAIYRGREDFVYRITIGELPFITSIFPLGGPAGAQTTVELTGWNLPAKRLTMDGRDKAPGIYPLVVRQGPWMSNAVPFAVGALEECFEKEPDSAGPLADGSAPSSPGLLAAEGQGGSAAAAQRVTLPVVVNGRIDRPDDSDVFCFEGKAGQQIVAEVYARRLNSPLDSVLKLTDAAGRVLASNDDHEDKGSGLTTHHADSYLRATLPTGGTYYLHLADTQHQGGPEYAYRLRISPPEPDFELRLVPASITIRAGATIPLTVHALRKDGFSGEIALTLKGAPRGCMLSGGIVPEGQDQVRLTLTVPPRPEPAPFPLSLEGRATIQGREVSHPVVPAEDMIQAFEYRQLVPAEELEVAVLGGRVAKSRFYSPTPPVRIVGDTPVKIPAGGTARIKLWSASRAALGKPQLQLFDPPEGIVIKDVASSREGVEIVLQSDAALVKPGLKGNLIVAAATRGAGAAGKAKPQASSRTTPQNTLPAIPFEVVGR